MITETKTDFNSLNLKQRYEKVYQIIQEIKSGERLHDQKYFHHNTDCGTAHCIAGWMIHEQFNYDCPKGLAIGYSETDEKGHVYKELQEEMCYKMSRDEHDRVLSMLGMDKPFTLAWAIALLHLSLSQGSLIFGVSRELDQIESNLIELANERFGYVLG